MGLYTALQMPCQSQLFTDHSSAHTHHHHQSHWSSTDQHCSEDDCIDRSIRYSAVCPAEPLQQTDARIQPPSFPIQETSVPGGPPSSRPAAPLPPPRHENPLRSPTALPLSKNFKTLIKTQLIYKTNPSKTS